MDKKLDQEYGTKRPLSSNGWTKDDPADEKDEDGPPPKITETVITQLMH